MRTSSAAHRCPGQALLLLTGHLVPPSQRERNRGAFLGSLPPPPMAGQLCRVPGRPSCMLFPVSLMLCPGSGGQLCPHCSQLSLSRLPLLFILQVAARGSQGASSGPQSPPFLVYISCRIPCTVNLGSLPPRPLCLPLPPLQNTQILGFTIYSHREALASPTHRGGGLPEAQELIQEG